MAGRIQKRHVPAILVYLKKTRGIGPRLTAYFYSEIKVVDFRKANKMTPFLFWLMLVPNIQGGIVTDIVKKTFLDLVLRVLPEEEPIKTRNNFELGK